MSVHQVLNQVVAADRDEIDRVEQLVDAQRRGGDLDHDADGHFLGKAHAPLFVNQDPNKADFLLPELSLPDNLSVERLESRKDILKLIDEQSDLLETSLVAQGLDESYQKAVAMLTSPRFKQAFDLTKESKKTRDAWSTARPLRSPAKNPMGSEIRAASTAL